MRDISQRKTIEQQLRLATRAAETANRAKSDFLANISHEIRTPLNAIVGLSEMLRSSVHSRDLRDSVDSIWVSAESLLALINDLLDVSRIEAGHITIDSQEFDPAAIAESAIGVLRARAGAKFLQLYLSVHPPAPPVAKGDPNRIRQILVNLVSNAIKFTESGYVHLELNWQSDDTGRVTLAFQVHDSGIGISHANRDQIFESFYRVDDPIVSQAGGVGLGLPISRALAERMGGSLGVESEAGRGSCFTLALPPLPCVRPGPGTAAGRRVILCSLPARLPFQSAVFASAGPQVLPAATPAEAEHLLAATPIPFVLAVDRDWAASQPAFTPPPSVPVLYIFMAQPAPPVDAGAIINPLTPARVTEALLRPGDNRPVRIAPDAPAPAVPAPSSANILLVEDNPAGQLYLRQLFTRAGFSVSVAASGAEALRAVASPAPGLARPDLILMDILLPDASGIDIVRSIRAAEAAAQSGPVPIITLTAHALTNYRTEAFAAGADDYLTKPARPGELLDAVRRWLKSPLTVLILAEHAGDALSLAARLPASRGYRTTVFLPGAAPPGSIEPPDTIVLHAVSPGAPFEAALSLLPAGTRRIAFGAGWTENQISSAAAGAPVPVPSDETSLRRLIRRTPAPAAAPSSPAAVDNQMASEIAAMAGSYLRSLQSSLTKAITSLQSGDLTEIIRFSHGMKGTASAYGFPVLSELGARLESAARQPNSIEVTGLLHEVRAYIEKLLQFRAQ